MPTGSPTFLTDDELKTIERMRKEKTHEEYKYLHLMEDVLNKGTEKSDRTGVGTLSIFGTNLKFNISKSIPVMTTKKVFWKGIVAELLWFINGETDSKLLEAQGVNIWKGNTSKEFLSKKGLNYEEGLIGPGYGFQWRNWGAKYGTSEKGIDQLQNIVDTLKTNPDDRRLFLSAWNVSDLSKISIPPCHLAHQYYVENGYLHLQWYQRSVDIFLGLNFNISSYALLTHIIAKIVGLKPGTITYCGGDTHIYLNHIEQVKEQISRTPFEFPTLNIKKDITCLDDIKNMTYLDFELQNYISHQAIKAPMAV